MGGWLGCAALHKGDAVRKFSQKERLHMEEGIDPVYAFHTSDF